MIKIDLTDLDRNLLADIASDTATDWAAYEVAANDLGGYQIIHSAEYERGGVVYIGSGSSGATEWTDAATPEEVLERLHADDMRP